MVAMEKNVEKQLVVRTFEPDLDALKQTARQLAHMQDVSLQLYRQAGEVLIVITARAFAQAAATELTESVAEQFELSLGDAVYGRGKSSLAHFAAGELLQSESILVASDEKTGALLDTEFSKTKRGATVYDFGEESYRDPRKEDKIRNDVYKYADEGDPIQTAAVQASAAARRCHADFGVSIVKSEDMDFFVAVAHKKYVYMRQIPNSDDAQKRAVLAALDIVRLVAAGKNAPKARVFRANEDIDWDDPIQQRRKKTNVGPIIALAVLLVALGVACWYFFTHFTVGENGDSVPVDGDSGISASVSVPDSVSVSVPESLPEGSGTEPDSGSSAPADSDVSAPAPDSAASGNTGVVHPFG